MSSEDIRLLSVYVSARALLLRLFDNIFLKDVDWHATNENVFASVGDDKMLMMCVSPMVPPYYDDSVTRYTAGIQERPLRQRQKSKRTTGKSSRLLLILRQSICL